MDWDSVEDQKNHNQLNSSYQNIFSHSLLGMVPAGVREGAIWDRPHLSPITQHLAAVWHSFI